MQVSVTFHLFLTPSFEWVDKIWVMEYSGEAVYFLTNVFRHSHSRMIRDGII